MASPTDITELGAHLGYWLRFVSNHVSQAFAAKLAGQGVTVAEWAMLRTLFGRGEMAPHLVADEMGMTRGAVSKLAERLLDKKLIARRATTEDKRGQMLALTAAGAALVPLLAALADENETAFFQHLNAEERARLYVLLQRLVRACGMQKIPVH